MSDSTTDQPLLTIHSIGNEIALALTPTHVVVRLSDEQLAKARQEIESEPERQRPGLIGAFVRAVTGFASHVVATTVRYPIADIDSVTNDNGVLTFKYNKRHMPSLDTFATDHGKPAYSNADAEAFVAKFNELKRAQG